MWQWMVLLNCFTIAIVNSICGFYLQERWNTNAFMWNYSIASALTALIFAYSDMPKKSKGKI